MAAKENSRAYRLVEAALWQGAIRLDGDGPGPGAATARIGRLSVPVGRVGDDPAADILLAIRRLPLGAGGFKDFGMADAISDYLERSVLDFGLRLDDPSSVKDAVLSGRHLYNEGTGEYLWAWGDMGCIAACTVEPADPALGRALLDGDFDVFTDVVLGRRPDAIVDSPDFLEWEEGMPPRPLHSGPDPEDPSADPRDRLVRRVAAEPGWAQATPGLMRGVARRAAEGGRAEIAGAPSSDSPAAAPGPEPLGGGISVPTSAEVISGALEARPAAAGRIAVCAGCCFNLVDPTEAAGISLVESGRVVSVDGREYRVMRGATWEDSRRIDGLLDRLGDLRIDDYGPAPAARRGQPGRGGPSPR